MLALVLCAFAASEAGAVGVAPSRLIPEADANAAGLTRAWFAQATLDRDVEEISSLTVQDDVLFVTTSDGFLQAFDAEKGTALWTVSVGDGFVTPPAVNSRVVAIICNTRLLIYDRFTGKKLAETEVYGQPSSGPVLSERECYVPVFSEKILAYPITKSEQEALQVNASLANMADSVKDYKNVEPEMTAKFAEAKSEADSRYEIEPLDDVRPFVCATFGISLVTPVMGTQTYAQDVVSWITEKGWIMYGEMERNTADAPFKLLYKLQDRPNFAYINERRLGNRAQIPRSDVEAMPFYIPVDKSVQNMRLDSDKRKGGMFIAGALSGHVYAMNDVTGLLRWTYITDKPISERISAFGDYAFIPTDNGDYFAVSLYDGKEAWRAQNIIRTVAASASRLYAIDSLNRLAVLNRETGARVKTLDIGNTKFQALNQWTDRVYVATADGLIQCLRETQQVEPLRHREACATVWARIQQEMNKVKPGAEKAAEPNPTAPQAAEQTEDEADDNPFESDDESDSSKEEEEENEEEEDSPFDDGSEDEEEEDPFA